jgi:Arc/MetJ family transcription regulator
MAATVQVDEDLMAEVMSLSEGRTEREVVEEALLKLRQIRQQRGMRDLRGIGWEGDLDAMRLDKPRPSIG